MKVFLGSAAALLGGGTIFFTFWQLGWLTEVVAFDLDLATLWGLFLAVTARYNDWPRTADVCAVIGLTLLFSAALVTWFSASSFLSALVFAVTGALVSGVMFALNQLEDQEEKTSTKPATT